MKKRKQQNAQHFDEAQPEQNEVTEKSETAKQKDSAVQKQMSLKKKILRSVIVLVVLAGVLTLGYYVLVWTGAWEYINSVDKIRGLILSLGFWGKFAFVMIQFLQVTFIPIPSTISTLAGVLIYGPLQAALLSLAGIILGSVVAFWLGRVFGKRLVVFMVGKETCEKWTKFLTDAKYSFFVMMVLPIFPDDVLCLVAGLTNMSWAFFVVTNFISRPIGVFTTCYLGSGHLIPYHGWGLIVWAFIVIATAIVIWLSYRYRAQIENFLKKHFSSKKRDDKRQTGKSDIAKTETGKLETEKTATKGGQTENKIKDANGEKHDMQQTDKEAKKIYNKRKNKKIDMPAEEKKLNTKEKKINANAETIVTENFENFDNLENNADGGK